MLIQRLDFKEFNNGTPTVVRTGSKAFSPNHKPKEEPPPPPPPPPVFSEEDMKSAERDGYKKGFLDGTEEGKKQAESEQAGIDRSLTNVVEKFAQSISPIFADYKALALQLRQDVPKVALAIARKVAGNALSEHADKVITDIAIRCCDSMINEPRLTITVHESLGNTLEAKLKEIASRLPATTDIVILRDPEMPLADCRIEWNHGAMEHRVAQLWQQLEKIIEGMSITALREGTAHMESLQVQIPEANEMPAKKEE